MTDVIDVLAPEEQEGTKAVVRSWLKAVGEPVALDEPLVELETDKVTQEIPAPLTGILHEILMQSGENAEPGAVLGRIRLEGASTAAVATPATAAAPHPAHVDQAIHYSPAVRRAIEDYGIDPATVAGTGKGGRVTRGDMDAAHEAALARNPVPATQPAKTPSLPSTRVDKPSGDLRARSVPHSPMRLAIAEHMQMSVSTAPHVTAVFEADFSAVIRHRDQSKAASGVSLSYTAYIVAACVSAMKAVPEVNSRWHGDRLDIFEDVNSGIGTALGNDGIVVPVIRDAQNLSLAGIAARLQDLTARARTNALTPADMRGGTFTISNHGVSGSLVATPIIINQPQSAILGAGKLEKRVVVREVDGVDTIQIRPMAYVSLTIDHRALDGHQTNAWLTRFVETLESWPR